MMMVVMKTDRFVQMQVPGDQATYRLECFWLLYLMATRLLVPENTDPRGGEQARILCRYHAAIPRAPQ